MFWLSQDTRPPDYSLVWLISQNKKDSQSLQHGYKWLLSIRDFQRNTTKLLLWRSAYNRSLASYFSTTILERVQDRLSSSCALASVGARYNKGTRDHESDA